jgi:hypothetical protein
VKTLAEMLRVSAVAAGAELAQIQPAGGLGWRRAEFWLPVDAFKAQLRRARAARGPQAEETYALTIHKVVPLAAGEQNPTSRMRLVALRAAPSACLLRLL